MSNTLKTILILILTINFNDIFFILFLSIIRKQLTTATFAFYYHLLSFKILSRKLKNTFRRQ